MQSSQNLKYILAKNGYMRVEVEYKKICIDIPKLTRRCLEARCFYPTMLSSGYTLSKSVLNV